jgi:hypothetical protein
MNIFTETEHSFNLIIRGMVQNHLAKHLASKVSQKNDLSIALNPFNKLPMRGNQLPVSADRWQHGSQICFGIFIY